MAHTLTPDIALGTDTEGVARLLTFDGTRVSDPHLDRWATDIDTGMLRGLYRDMALLRRIDKEGMALQRQGQLGLWAPCQGQEATQIGTARVLRTDDFAFPSYRETGVVFARGGTPEAFLRAWRGEAHSSYDPYALGVAVQQIIIGAQTLHAVGYGMGIQRDGADQVVATWFGDGATSQGDVNEAMVFAASYQAPVVFVCSNNQYAISEPVRVQAHAPIASRAPGFGIPSLRVDGNDVMATTAAMRWAVDHARTGHGPAFIECVTYRMGPHTTSDDPTRYRDDAEMEKWRRRDPLTRVEAYLRSQGAFDDAFAAEVGQAADEIGTAVRETCLAMTSSDPLTILDDVYAEPHTGIDEEREWFTAYLDGFAAAEA